MLPRWKEPTTTSTSSWPPCTENIWLWIKCYQYFFSKGFLTTSIPHIFVYKWLFTFIFDLLYKLSMFLIIKNYYNLSFLFLCVIKIKTNWFCKKSICFCVLKFKVIIKIQSRYRGLWFHQILQKNILLQLFTCLKTKDLVKTMINYKWWYFIFPEKVSSNLTESTSNIHF